MINLLLVSEKFSEKADKSPKKNASVVRTTVGVLLVNDSVAPSRN